MGIGGKFRSSRRSSSVSYASTITTVIFVTLCVFGVWMLSSNSVAAPQTTTTRTAIDADAADNSFSSAKEEQTTKNVNNGDNPEQLPDDAIQTVEENQHGLQGKEMAEEQGKQKSSEVQISEESVLTQNQQSKQSSTEGFEENKQTGNEERETKKNQDSEEDQSQIMEQQREDKRKQKVESNEKTKETTNVKTKEDDDQEKSKENEDPQKVNKEQQESQLQGIENATFSDETKDKQKEILSTNQTDSYQDLLKTLTNTETTENDTQSEAQNQVTQQQQDSNSDESLRSSIPKESSESKKSWKTQKTESENEKERGMDETNSKASIYGYNWQLCNVTAGPDYVPCLDNEKALKNLHSYRHFEHRERHYPEEVPTCLVPLPEGYKRPIPWPQSRDKIWYHNVPRKKLAVVKGHQNWVKVSGEFLTFPGGGTQFIDGALHYIDFIQQSVPDIKWGKHTRVILDVGCGVAGFGGYLFERDVLTMSFAPKDEHEAQVQSSLERGIPAISAVMGSQRLPFPSRVFAIVHCARCRVPWHREGGLLLLELNRALRPGGYFVWSATPVYQKLKEDVEIWKGRIQGKKG